MYNDERKTLSGLYRQWVEAPDVSAVADFFRISPWLGQEMGIALSRFVMNDMIRRVQAQGIEPTIFVSIDDSLTQKDKGTTALEAVAWFHDHDVSTKQKPVYSQVLQIWKALFEPLFVLLAQCHQYHQIS